MDASITSERRFYVFVFNSAAAIDSEAATTRGVMRHR